MMFGWKGQLCSCIDEIRILIREIRILFASYFAVQILVHLGAGDASLHIYSYYTGLVV